MRYSHMNELYRLYKGYLIKIVNACSNISTTKSP